MRPVNEMSDMQNRKKQEQQKDTHLKDKIGLHTQMKKNTSFPIENLTLSEQTCETNNMYQNVYHFTTFKKNHIKITAQKKQQQTTSSNHPNGCQGTGHLDPQYLGV